MRVARSHRLLERIPRTMQGQRSTGWHTQEHQVRAISPRKGQYYPGNHNITQGPLPQTPDSLQRWQSWARKKNSLGVGGEMGEEESTVQEKGFMDGGKRRMKNLL